MALLSPLQVEAKSPTCKLTVTLQQGGIATGSGTAYHKNVNGVYLLTCKHLIKGATYVTLQNCNGQSCKLIHYVPVTADFDQGKFDAWVYAVHPTEDLALAFIPLRGPKLAFSVTPIASFTPNPGEPCVSQGHPYGRELLTLRGTLLPNNSLSYPLQQGMSGGGVFQGNRLIGVGVATDNTSGLFVPAHIIRDFTNRPYTFQLVEGPIDLEAVRPQEAQGDKVPEAQGDKVQGDKVPDGSEWFREGSEGPVIPRPRVPEPVKVPKVVPVPEPVKVPEPVPVPDKVVPVPDKVVPVPDKVPDAAKLERIDKLEKTVKIIGTVANFVVPGAGIAGALLGTGLGFILRRKVSRRSKVTNSPKVTRPEEPEQSEEKTVFYPQRQPVPFPVVYTPPPPEQVIHTETYPTEVEVDKWSKRFAWAKAQMCQKEPGSIATLERLEAFMKQCKK